jgi:hypothetical protein
MNTSTNPYAIVDNLPVEVDTTKKDASTKIEIKRKIEMEKK